jgi:hypothetical protein
MAKSTVQLSEAWQRWEGHRDEDTKMGLRNFRESGPTDQGLAGTGETGLVLVQPQRFRAKARLTLWQMI